MNITVTIRDLLNTTDPRVHGRIGSNALFTDRCDRCDQHATVLTETITEHARGADVEGGIYCLDHAAEAIDALTLGDADQITVTVPASLLATDLAA